MLQFMDFPGGSDGKEYTCNAGDLGLIPGWGTKIPHAVWCSHKLNKYTF